jgi:PIN domain nuclease of toxin-antitoxin system
MLSDTYALIWLALAGGQLSAKAKQAIDEATAVYVSSISTFEIAYASARGRLELPCDAERWYYEVLDKHSLTEVLLSGKIAIASTKLPMVHKDPCDRFIIATAQLESLSVVTTDRIFRKYDIVIID